MVVVVEVKVVVVVVVEGTLLKLTLLHGCFSRFLNCTNSTKSRNASQMSSLSAGTNPNIVRTTSVKPKEQFM